MSIHDNTKILKQPIFDTEGNFQEWQEFSPKSSANSVYVSTPTGDTSVADALGQLGHAINSRGDYSWQNSSGGSTSKHYPCVYLGAGDAITALSAAADHSVTMRNTINLDFLILSLPSDVTPTFALRLLTEEKTSDAAEIDFTQRLVQRLVNSDRYTVTLQRTGAGAIAHVEAAGSGVNRILLDADASLTERSVVGALLTAYTDV